MACDGADFHEIQVGILEKAAGGLVAQVMEMEVREPGPFTGPDHGFGHGIGVKIKEPVGRGGLFTPHPMQIPENLYGPG